MHTHQIFGQHSNTFAGTNTRAQMLLISPEWYRAAVFVKFERKMLQGVRRGGGGGRRRKKKVSRKSLIVQTVSQQRFAFLVLRALFVAWEAVWTRGEFSLVAEW